MYVGFEQVVAGAAVKTRVDLNIPANATGCMLRATTGNILYTCDEATDPTATVGMPLLTTDLPFEMLIEDLRRIRFRKSGAGADCTLHIHYFGGRASFAPDPGDHDPAIKINFLAGLP